jgi:hypothetical protein
METSQYAAKVRRSERYKSGMKETSGWTGEREYAGNGGRSYIAEALEVETEKLAAIVAKGIVRIKSSYSGAHEGVKEKSLKVCCLRKERRKKCFFWFEDENSPPHTVQYSTVIAIKSRLTLYHPWIRTPSLLQSQLLFSLCKLH